MNRLFCILAAAMLLLNPVPAAGAPAGEENSAYWYALGKSALRESLQAAPVSNNARNIILFIGDGMGITTVTAARIFEGQSRGGYGEEHLLSFERFPHLALIKTYNTDHQVPDSAGTMSAIMTGVKTRSGVISVDPSVIVGDCASAQGKHLATLLELFEDAGRSTGIVTTTRVTHATPAAAYAHSPNRDWESDVDLTAGARTAGCIDIAAQLVDFPRGNGMEVVLGGGRREFLPHDAPDPEYAGATGKRRDGRNLIADWQRRNAGAVFVWNAVQFAAIDLSATNRLLGLFEPSHMQYETDRNADRAGEPSLAEMTGTAINILRKNPDGFLLIVEGGRIDHAHHAGNAYRALNDTRAFADAVARAIGLVDLKETLILVTADHSHVLVMGGYPVRGNPILGRVIESDDAGQPRPDPAGADDGFPFTTLGYWNGPGAIGRADLRGTDTGHPDYRQQALVPMESETHGGEDISAYAVGTWSHLVHGVQEQNYLFHIMLHAAGLDK